MTALSPAGLSPLLDQLDEARAKGTPGEWGAASSGAIDAGDYDTVIGRGPVDCMAHCYGGTSTIEGDNLAADVALIVAAVNAVPQLTAAIRAVAELTQGWRSTTAPLALQLAGDDVHEALAAALTPGADTAGATA